VAVGGVGDVQGTSAALVRDERFFLPLTAGDKSRVEDIDLALQMVRPEYKAIQMAESIFDGDDPVQQFARHLPQDTADRPIPLAGETTILAAKEPSAAESKGEATQAVLPPPSGVDWRVILIAPGAALVAGVIWRHVCRHHPQKV
jgi:hypothetical protein